MNLDTIEITPEEAAARLEEYRGQLASERTAEDDAIAAGYRAAARGLPVIMLSEVMSAGGWFDNGLPRLAVARADTEQCFVRVRRHSVEHRWGVDFGDSGWPDIRARHVGRHGVVTDMEPPDWWTGQGPYRGRTSGQTVVPIVPPRFRPKRRRMHGVHILWEVEAWDPTPPKDPALLRHIRGDLWSVLAVWDLTELERAVLSARQS